MPDLNLKRIGYALSTRPLKQEKPKVIQFPVIDICNSRCQMCRIWENKSSDDITFEQLRKGLKNQLYSEVVSVGINGGEPTLRKDLAKLIEVLYQELPSLKNIALITNAYKHEQVIERIQEVGEVVSRYDGFLDVMISLDGYAGVHDAVRGKPGNFERAQHVIKYIKTSPLVNTVRIGCTVIKENVYQLHDLLEYCIENDLYIKYRLGIPHKRLYTDNLADPYALTFNEKYELTEFLENLIVSYEKQEFQKTFYRSLIGQIMHDQPRMAGCDWQHRGVTITAKGELLYCAVESNPIVNQIDLEDSWLAYTSNRSHQLDIYNTKCADCNHDYVGVPEAHEYRRRIVNRVKSRINNPAIKKLPFFSLLKESKRKANFTSRRKKLLSFIDKPICVKKAADEKSILICGWYGTETLGDKAIIAGVMQVFRTHFGDKTKFIVASLNTYITEMTKIQMSEFFNTQVVNIQTAIGMAQTVDYVVFGGGPIMAINEIADMEAIFMAAKNGKGKTVVAGCGVGPLGLDVIEQSIKNILNLSDIRLYRDTKSKDYATQLGVETTDDIVVEDPAFTWLKNIESSLPSTNRNDGKRIVLLGLREFPFREYAADLSIEKAEKLSKIYENEVLDALDKITNKYTDIVIQPLPMCTNHFGSDDRWFYRQMFRKNERLNNSIDLTLLGPELSPIEYCKAFKEASVLLAMRFHSLVFGLSLGLPSVAIDYTLGRGKVRSLSERFDVPFISLADISSDWLVENIESQLEGKNSNKFKHHELKFSTALQQKLDPVKSKEQNENSTCLLV